MKSILFSVVAGIMAVAAPANAQDAAAAPGDVKAGEAVFKKCLVCHQVGPDAKNAIGPVLNGVVGRPAGTYPGYSYSAANKNSGQVWNEPTLATYLRAPGKLMPGTRMSFPGLKKSQEIADVIAYLKQFNQKGGRSEP